MWLPLKIALRFLKASKGQTLLILFGIAVGVSVQIFLGLLIQGLQRGLVEKTIGASPHITITSKKDNKKIDFPEEKTKMILPMKNSVKNLNIAVDSPAFIREKTRTEPVLVRGFTMEQADSLYNISNSLVEGRLPYKQREVLVGKDLMDKLDLAAGGRISLLTPQGESFELVVSGIYDLNVSSINKSWVITDIKTARGIFNVKGAANVMEMQVYEVFSADTIAGEIRSKLADDSLSVEDWKSQNSQLLSGLSGQSSSSMMIQVFVLLSVILGITSILAITVMQKSKQLGILKAMGIKDRSASLIFLFQGLLLGVMGALGGVALGLGLSKTFTTFALNPDGSPLVNIYYDLKFIISSGIIAVLAAMAAALTPARRSAGLNPVEVIRNG